MQITKEPNKILHKTLFPVVEVNDEIRALIEEMRATMVEAKGIGLAANQIGRDAQIFVIDKKLAEENNAPDVYINPALSVFSREKDAVEEGCLSIPGFWRQVRRSKRVHIKALDEQGKKIKLKARGFWARVLQHEYDHLMGTTIKDKTG